jgi:hypothetical protein
MDDRSPLARYEAARRALGEHRRPADLAPGRPDLEGHARRLAYAVARIALEDDLRQHGPIDTGLGVYGLGPDGLLTFRRHLILGGSGCHGW